MSGGLVNVDEERFRALVKQCLREVLAEERVANSAELLTVGEAAKLAKVAQGTIRRWLSEGKLQYQRAGRHKRIRRADLEKWLAGHQPGEHLTPEQVADRDFG
jgi:excisionase family DNA binding protein